MTGYSGRARLASGIGEAPQEILAPDVEEAGLQVGRRREQRHPEVHRHLVGRGQPVLDRLTPGQQHREQREQA